MPAPQPNANTAWVLRLALRDRGGWLCLVCVTVLTSLISLAHPWPLKLLLDHVLSPAPMPAWALRIAAILPYADSPLGFAAYVAIAGVILFVIDAILDVIIQRQWIRTMPD